MEKKITIGTVCFLIDEKEDKILLLKRNKEPMKSMFTGVGGKTNFEEDIKESCVREIKEETGYDAHQLSLKGVVKTVLQEKESTWILFVYSCNDFSGREIICDEGELHWIKRQDIYKTKLIGFIREILPDVLKKQFFETTILHGLNGDIIHDK